MHIRVIRSRISYRSPRPSHRIRYGRTHGRMKRWAMELVHDQLGVSRSFSVLGYAILATRPRPTATPSSRKRLVPRSSLFMYLSGASTTNTPSSFYTHFQCCTKCEVAQHPTLLLHLARAIIGTDRAESTSCAVPINHTSDGHARRCDVKPDTRVIRPKLRTHSAQPTHRAPSTGRRPAAPRRAHATRSSVARRDLPSIAASTRSRGRREASGGRERWSETEVAVSPPLPSHSPSAALCVASTRAPPSRVAREVRVRVARLVKNACARLADVLPGRLAGRCCRKMISSPPLRRSSRSSDSSAAHAHVQYGKHPPADRRCPSYPRREAAAAAAAHHATAGEDADDAAGAPPPTIAPSSDEAPCSARRCPHTQDQIKRQLAHRAFIQRARIG